MVLRRGGLLLGRGTYEIFAGHWPKAPQEGDPIAQALNEKTEHVASLGEGVVPATWRLTASFATSTGAMIAGYQRAGEVRSGTFALDSAEESTVGHSAITERH